MKPNYPPLNLYTIKYDYEQKCFYMLDKDKNLVARGDHGRELGRDAWDSGADEVKYDYDLGLDEKIPMRPRHGKYY